MFQVSTTDKYLMGIYCILYTDTSRKHIYVIGSDKLIRFYNLPSWQERKYISLQNHHYKQHHGRYTLLNAYVMNLIAKSIRNNVFLTSILACRIL